MPPITQATLTWPFKDAEWPSKFLIGSLLVLAGSFVPFIGWLGYFAVFGYCLIFMRDVIRGAEPTLPKWDRFGEMFVDGLKAGVAAVGYFIPVLLVIFLMSLFLFGSSLLGGVLDGLAARNGVQLTPILLGGTLLVNLGLAGIISIVSLICLVPVAIAVGQYARTGDIGSGYDLHQVRAILRANASGFLVALLLFLAIRLGLNLVLSLLYFTIILCFLSPFLQAPVLFYLLLLWTNLFGIMYRDGALKAGIIPAASTSPATV